MEAKFKISLSINLLVLILLIGSTSLHQVTVAEGLNLTLPGDNSTNQSIILSIQANHSIIFIDNFEYTSSLESNGYNIYDGGDQNMIAITSSSAGYNESRGLHMKSNPNVGAASISRNLDIPYVSDLTLSLFAYNHGLSGTFRISFRSQDNWIELDYGQVSGAGWEPEGSIYDVGIQFPVGQWYHLERNLDLDIETALNAAGSPLNTFIPDRIGGFKIFQDGDGGENYFDDIAIIGPPDTSLTTTSPESLTTGNTITTTRSSGPFDSALIRALGIIFLAIFGGGVLYYTRRPVVSKPPADPGSYVQAQETDETTANISINFCGNCGSPISGQDPFCGECGIRN